MRRVWLVNLKPCERPRLRLICFPFGGAGAGSFWSWCAELESDVELWALRLPGRENRIAEPFATDAAEVVARVEDELSSLEPTRTAFYGHSVGAALALQTAGLLRARGRPLPELLLTSGRSPPHVPYPGDWGRRSDSELIAHVRELGSVPEELWADERMRPLYLKKLRADYLLNETVPYERVPAFPFPITIINGASDPLVDAARLPEWADYTSSRFESLHLAGAHFFMQAHFAEFMSIVRARLATLL